MSASKQKWEQLAKRMEALGISEKELLEKFILGSGKGGQKINKTSSCVYLKHLPTGLEIKCQKTRERELNRYYARQALCEMLEEKILGQKTQKQQEREKIRRQKRRRSRRSQEKIVEKKRERSSIKEGRKPPKNVDKSV